MTIPEEFPRPRREKLERLRQRGIDPYPARFRRSHSAAEALALYQAQPSPTPDHRLNTEVTLAGRLISIRVMGKITFAHLLDGTGKIQICLRPDLLGQESYAVFRDLDLGDFLGAKGYLFRTRSGEITLEVHHYQLLAKALRPLPEKWHGLSDVEKRYRQRYLDLIANPGVRQIFTLRSRIIAALRRFMDGRGFLEVETPVLQAQAGGAAARPFRTYHQALDRELYLRIATELHLKRLLVAGLDKVYEIGRIFRNEGISIKHNPEFTMMESYEAYADYHDVMAMVEEMLYAVAQEVLGTPQVPWKGESIDFTPPWRRLSLRQAIQEAAGIDFQACPDAASLRAQMLAAGMDAEEGLSRAKLIDELLSSRVEPTLIQPTFLLDYPVELSPLAKAKPDNPSLVERFEGFAGGMEIANAFTELNDPLEQRERFRQQLAAQAAGQEEAELPDEDFLVALEHGMPPAGGLGLGIDRVVMLLTDQRSIREVILFPQMRTRE